MTSVTVAALQFACVAEKSTNIRTASRLVREAAGRGAQVILLPELFEGEYFCKDQDPRYFEWAHPRLEHPLLKHFSALAAELEVVLPISFFERAGNAFFNSLVVLDADGRDLGLYRKSHIPDGPGYQEKFYFSPGDTGFRVWETRHARVGVAICWDQWFPEAARAMALQGAELLLYPTAIGSEPQAPEWDSRDHWQRVMQGHAAANLVPVVASNRIGVESGASCSLTFYGSSFIAGPLGDLRQAASRDQEEVLLERLDLEEIRSLRQAWGLFRDRRPELYRSLGTLDGNSSGIP
jgi:N-carbamoylputrescine amidase